MVSFEMLADKQREFVSLEPRRRKGNDFRKKSRQMRRRQIRRFHIPRSDRRESEVGRMRRSTLPSLLYWTNREGAVTYIYQARSNPASLNWRRRADFKGTRAQTV